MITMILVDVQIERKSFFDFITDWIKNSYYVHYHHSRENKLAEPV